jgi:hypothetical protein
MKRTQACITIALLALAAVAAVPALAALGGNVASVDSDRAHLKAQLKSVSPGAGFSVHEMQLPSGTLVREYVAADGTVFAVTWHGPTKPDLSATLGTYFQQYVDAAKSSPHGAAARRHFQVRQPDLVVQSNGRMRAYSGRAYVPSLLPPNVSLDEIQ